MNSMKIFHFMRDELAQLEKLDKRIDDIGKYLDEDDIRAIEISRIEVEDKKLRQEIREVIDMEYCGATDKKREFVKSAANRMKEFLESLEAEK